MFRYWVVLFLGLGLELLLDLCLREAKSVPTIVYTVLKISFVSWILAPVSWNGSDVIFDYVLSPILYVNRIAAVGAASLTTQVNCFHPPYFHKLFILFLFPLQAVDSTILTAHIVLKSVTETTSNFAWATVENSSFMLKVTAGAGVQALEATWGYTWVVLEGSCALLTLVVEGLVEGATAGAQLAQTGIKLFLTSQVVNSCVCATASAASAVGKLGGQLADALRQLATALGQLVKASLR